MIRVRSIWHDGWQFGLLCVVTASRWLVEGALPETSSTLLSQAVGCAVAAGLVAILDAIHRSRRFSGRNGDAWSLGALRSGAPGACLVLVGPVVAQILGGRHIGADAATLALALVPVVVAVAVSSSGGAETGDLPGLLWPGLAGIAGLLLILPEPALTSWRAWGGLGSLPLLVGLGAWLADRTGAARPDGEAVSGHAKVIGGMLLGAIVFGAFWMFTFRQTAPSLSWAACGLDGLSAWLTLRALTRMGVRRWSAQFLLVPLLGLLEALVFLRPVLDWRSWMGLVLVGLGGAYLLSGRGAESAELPSLRVPEDVPEA